MGAVVRGRVCWTVVGAACVVVPRVADGAGLAESSDDAKVISSLRVPVKTANRSSINNPNRCECMFAEREDRERMIGARISMADRDDT
jgi:hypothetical protein